MTVNRRIIHDRLAIGEIKKKMGGCVCVVVEEDGRGLDVIAEINSGGKGRMEEWLEKHRSITRLPYRPPFFPLFFSISFVSSCTNILSFSFK